MNNMRTSHVAILAVAAAAVLGLACAEPEERPAGQAMAPPAAQTMTSDEMVRHMNEMHGRVGTMRGMHPGMDGGMWQHMDEMGQAMATMAATLDRMTEGHPLRGDAAFERHLEDMRRHLSEVVRDYRAMLEAMERVPPATPAS